MSLSCKCEVERNSFPDMEVRKKDKNKVVQVFKISTSKDGLMNEDLRIIVKFQKSMETAIDFSSKEI